MAIGALILSGCGSSGQGGGAEAGGQRGPQGPKKVGFVVMQPASVPVISELSGRITAFQSSEVRPQISGIIRKRYFTEGGLVRQGQPLYQIDASLYRAAVNQAQAQLASAQATAEAARQRAERYRPLAEMEAVARQDYTDVLAQARQAQAATQQTRAQLEAAQINLRYTTVPAPISGRIGRSLFTEGALVTSNQVDPLTTIQRLDPVYVDIQQSSADVLALRRSLAGGGVVPAAAEVRLLLEDGSEYGFAGRIEFSEVVVSPTTGTVTLRARVSNPQGLLLPGMFVRARFAQAVDTRAFLVPQQAVIRNARGLAHVFVVGRNKRAEQRMVDADRSSGANWIVTRGLNPGDKVITQGLAQLKPNTEIEAVSADAPQPVAPPKRPMGN